MLSMSHVRSCQLAYHSAATRLCGLDRCPALQRSDGEVEIVFRQQGEKTALAHLFQRAPCRVLFPRVAAGDISEAVLLTTSGGITGGDRLKITVSAESHASALVTTQAAEKIYRSLGPPARASVSLRVGNGAWLEWLPQETILFDRARLERRLEADVAMDGRLIAAEMITFGRLARGERFTNGLLLDRWRVHRAGRLVWVDALRLEGDCTHTLNDSLGFAGARAVATVIYVAPDVPDRHALARALTKEAQGQAGATMANGVLLARFLSQDPSQLRIDLARYLGNLRHEAAGLPERPPHLWRC